MAAATPVYDLMLMLDADAPSERRAEILREVEAYVQRGGTIVRNDDWGVRSLAYEIQHHKDAEYHLLQFSGPAEMIDRLGAMLRITDGVLRHRVIKVLPGTPDPPTVRAEPRAATASVAAPSAPAAEGQAAAAEPQPAAAAPAETAAEPAPAETAAEPAPAGEPVAAEGDETPAEAPPAA